MESEATLSIVFSIKHKNPTEIHLVITEVCS